MSALRTLLSLRDFIKTHTHFKMLIFTCIHTRTHTQYNTHLFPGGFSIAVNQYIFI